MLDEEQIENLQMLLQEEQSEVLHYSEDYSEVHDSNL